MPVSPKRFVHLVKSLLLHGLTPEGISLSISLGFAGAIFPILGTTSVVCLFFAAVFRLNHAITQSINWLAMPVHLALIFPFLRIGERLFHATPVSLNLGELMAAFHASPMAFLGRFSMSFVHAIAGWLIVMPGVVVLLHLLLRAVLRRYARRHRAEIHHHPAPASPS